MAGLRQRLCRHDYQVVERIENAGTDSEMEISVLRCSKCGRTRIVAAAADRVPIGQGDMGPDSVSRTGAA